MHKELVLSFTLAVAIVGGALWFLDGQFAQMKAGIPPQAVSSPQTLPPAQLMDDPVTNVLSPQPENVEGTPATRGKIQRCIVGGKTIYSDEKCPTGAEVKVIEMHHAAGIVSPPKPVLSELTAQRKAVERIAEQERDAVQRVARASRSKQSECQWLDEQIGYLDSLARQPQSGYSQDRIREERAALRNRQFGLHC